MISCPYHWLHRFCGDGMIIQALRRCSFFLLIASNHYRDYAIEICISK